MSKIRSFSEAIAKHEGFYIDGSVAQRDNSPGNIIFGSLAKAHGATTFWKHPKTGHEFAIFPTVEDGFAALDELLINACTGKSKIYSPDWTILQFFTKYSPVRNSKGEVISNVAYASAVAKQVGVSMYTKIKDLIEPISPTGENGLPNTMKNYHLFSHMDRNLVRKGDKVIQYVTPIGTIGDGNGQYFAHLHFSISNGLTPAQLKAYISGWSKTKVQQFYKDPRKVDFAKMFGTKMDVGNFGYGWLEWVGYGYHPGVDVNGLKGGNTDFGMPFKASCSGVVIDEWRGWTKNHGWGNWIVISED
jgi:hypothetical protein